MRLRKMRSIFLLIIIIIVIFLIIQGSLFLIGRLFGTREIIVIDPGHGGKDPGTIGINGRYEKDINLEISKKLYQKLKSMDYKVLLTRDNDEYIDNEMRADIANKREAKVFISIHCNALENDNITNGVQVLYRFDVENDSNIQDNESLAQLVLDKILASTGATNRGIVERTDLIVLNQAKVPTILVECGFLSNENEANQLLEDEYQNKIADAISNALETYLNNNDKK